MANAVANEVNDLNEVTVAHAEFVDLVTQYLIKALKN